jgi:hypothetical protein
MGEYRLGIYWRWSLTIGISYDGQILIQIPFVDVRISVSDNAKGRNFWNVKNKLIK